MVYARSLQRPKTRQAQVKKFPAPTAGWISNRALAVPSGDGGNLPQGALILDNFFVNATSVRLRGGKLLYATLGFGETTAQSLFSYRNGENRRLFGADENAIYDLTTVPFPEDQRIATENDDPIVTQDGDFFGWSSTGDLVVLDGFTGGDWSVVQFASTGGVYLVGVNGKDEGFIYDGETFYPYAAGGFWNIPIDNETSPFSVGDIVTGTTSGATGVVYRVDANQLVIRDYDFPPELWEIDYVEGASAFTIGSTLRGETSNASALIDGLNPGETTWALGYDGGTVLFVVDEVVTGDTSGASGIVTAVAGDATNGTLTIKTLSGTFTDNETLTGDIAGAAVMNGTASAPILSGTIALRNLIGSFIQGEEIRDTTAGRAKSADTQAFVSGGGFQNDETIISDTGGNAEVDGDYTNAIPGATFPNGLTSADMSFVWVYKNRLYFVEADTLNAWYLDIDSVGGDAKRFPLAGVFGLGGSLLFGQRWSLSSGGDGGLSEQCVFVSTEGEVAVYQGLSPDDTATWAQQGLYRVGRPLGKRAFIRGAGDIAIATSVGLVPLSKAIELDLTALTTASISYPIADAWSTAINLRGSVNWQGYIWPEKKVAVLAPPTGEHEPVIYVANTETGAWSRFTGWDARCFEVFEGELYFGGPNGQVFKADRTGIDHDTPYTGTILPLYDDLGSPASLKIATVGRYIYRASIRVSANITWQGDYNESLPAPPNAANLQSAPSVWGLGVWGSSRWTTSLPRVLMDDWHSLAGSAYTVSVAFQITSGATLPLELELISSEVLYNTADAVS